MNGEPMRSRALRYLLRNRGFSNPWNVPDGTLRDAMLILMGYFPAGEYRRWPW